MNFKLKFNAINKFMASFIIIYCLSISLSFASNLFEVNNIYVDVTSSSSSTARDKAMKKANRIAVTKVIRSLVLKSDFDKIPEITDEFLINYVLETSVANEKTSSVRYMANLNIKTDEKAIKKYLVDNQVPFVLEVAPKAVIVPLYLQSGKKAVLWQNNKWLDAWKQNRVKSSLVPLVIPNGDLSDINSISANQAEVLNSAAIKNIANTHGVKDVYVINASKKSPEKFEAYIQFLSEKHPYFTSVELDTTPDMSEEVILSKVLALVKLEIEDTWKKQNVISYDQTTNAIVVAKIDKLTDWLKMKKVISSLSYVKNVNLRAIKKGQAQFEMNFFGDKYRLIAALEDENLRLYEYGNIWVIEGLNKAIGE